MHEKGLHTVLTGKPEGKNRYEDPHVDARIIKWMFKIQDERVD
jgi:hypothetical protein